MISGIGIVIMLTSSCASIDRAQSEYRAATSYSTELKDTAGNVTNRATFSIQRQLLQQISYRYAENGSLTWQMVTDYREDGGRTETETWYATDFPRSSRQIRVYDPTGQLMSERNLTEKTIRNTAETRGTPNNRLEGTGGPRTDRQPPQP